MKFKKIVAVVSSIAMLASMMAFSAVTANAAGEPTAKVTVSYPNGSTNAGDKITIQCYLENFDVDKYLDTYQIYTSLSDTEDYLDFSSTSAYTATAGTDIVDCKASVTRTKKLLKATYVEQAEDPGDWGNVKNCLLATYEFKLLKDLDKTLPISLVADDTFVLVYDDQDNESTHTAYSINQDYGAGLVEAALKTDVGSIEPQTPAPSETIPTATTATPVFDGTTWPATAATATAIGGTYTGVMEGDTAVAYGVGLKGDNVTTYSKVMWKVTAKGESKGHEMTLNTPIGGEGTAKVGLAIQGLTAADVEAVSAAFVN